MNRTLEALKKAYRAFDNLDYNWKRYTIMRLDWSGAMDDMGV